MSALAQQDILSSVEYLSELDATREIGRLATSGAEVDSTLEAIVETILRMSGMRRVGFERLASGSTGADTGSGPSGRAIEKIAAGGRHWGELQIEFDLWALQVESPVRFTRFVAEQIAGLLNLWELRRRRSALEESIGRLRSGLATRKAVDRAKGIVARSQDISEPEALDRLRRESQESGRSLRHVAEAVISGAAGNIRAIGARR